MKKTTRLVLLIGLGMFAAAGCLMSGTFVLTLHLNSFDPNSPGLFEAHGVDLTTEDVWKDHKDDIKNISDVRFRAKIENTSAAHATGEVYFSSNGTYTTPAQVRAAADAFIVFGGLGIPAGEEKTLTFAESAKYRQNLDKALALVEVGTFYLYVLTPEDTFQLHVTDVYVMVTLDAGPAD